MHGFNSAGSHTNLRPHDLHSPTISFFSSLSVMPSISDLGKVRTDTRLRLRGNSEKRSIAQLVTHFAIGNGGDNQLNGCPPQHAPAIKMTSRSGICTGTFRQFRQI